MGHIRSKSMKEVLIFPVGLNGVYTAYDVVLVIDMFTRQFIVRVYTLEQAEAKKEELLKLYNS